MKTRRWIAENTTLLSLLMILVGVVLILLSDKVTHAPSSRLIESFGVLFSSVFFVSFLYEKFLAEKHFSEFRISMHEELLRMDNVQGVCTRLGIREIFETRNDFEQSYPLSDVINQMKTGGRVLVVARTLFHLLNKTEMIRSALIKGINFQLVCVDPQNIDQTLAKISFIKVSDIKTPLEVLEDLCEWAEKEHPQGSLELRASKQPLPDSFFLADLEDRNIAFWDLTFGRDLTHKKVFVMEPALGNLGMHLTERYETIFSCSIPILKIEPEGNISKNELKTSISTCS